jgi:hypothetical protein
VKAGTGTGSKRRWTTEEDYFVLDHPDMTAKEVGLELGRTKRAVTHRRQVLQSVERTAYTARGARREDPANVGRRTVIAATCHTCGRLLDRSCFRQSRGGWMWFKCKRCIRGDEDLGLRRQHRDKDAWQRQYKVLQDFTRERAHRHREPVADSDVKVFEDVSKSLLEMALETGRTYSAVASQRHNLGLDPIFPTQEEIHWVIRFCGNSQVAK